jgi:hypothetical protein
MAMLAMLEGLFSASCRELQAGGLCSPEHHFNRRIISVYRLRRFRVWAAFFAARERLAALRLLAARLA